MTEAYQVLARKWRPQLFSELAGLEHITRTLMNAIRLNRIGHAFLFTGSRGVGKTSAARIFAKALNCKTGPVEEPCNLCENCIAITAGNAADVIEIDGASNRGIDEIRLLRENVTYLPQNSPYKIYIIDEVHMLTTEAFNALLKTLEEPPAHVKFIMATTDVHKMPMTILSRCQRFDFGRLTQAVIAATLEEIGDREKLEFAAGATELLAREAQGSMRDALSLLDQARSYAGETISVVDLRQALGLIESQHCFSLLENIVCGEVGAAVSQVAELEQAGVDLKRFSEEFLFYLRDALFLKLSPKLKSLLGVSSDEIELLVPLVSDCNLPYWQQLFALWQQHHGQIKTSQTPRLALEMALVELGMARDLEPVAELVGRIDKFLKTGPAPEKPTERIKQPVKSRAPVKNIENPAAVTVSENRVSVTDRSATSAPATKVAPEQMRPREQTPAPIRTVGPVTQNRSSAALLQTDSSLSSARKSLPPGSGNLEMPPEPPSPPDEFTVCDSNYESSLPPLMDTKVDSVVAAVELPSAQPVSEKVVSGKEKVVPAPSAPVAVAPAGPEQKVIPSGSSQNQNIGDIPRESISSSDWARFVGQLANKNARLGSMLQGSEAHLAASGTLQLAVVAHALIVLDNDSVKTDIITFWNQFQGSKKVTKIELRPLAAAAAMTVPQAGVAASDNSAPGRRTRLGKEEIFNDPSVRFISERFGGRVTEIRKNN